MVLLKHMRCSCTGILLGHAASVTDARPAGQNHVNGDKVIQLNLELHMPPFTFNQYL